MARQPKYKLAFEIIKSIRKNDYDTTKQLLNEFAVHLTTIKLSGNDVVPVANAFIDHIHYYTKDKEIIYGIRNELLRLFRECVNFKTSKNLELQKEIKEKSYTMYWECGINLETVNICSHNDKEKFNYYHKGGRIYHTKANDILPAVPVQNVVTYLYANPFEIEYYKKEGVQ